MRIGIDIGAITATRTGVGNYCFYLLKHLLSQSPESEFLGYSTGRARVALDALAGRISHRRIPLPTRVMYGLWTALGGPGIDRFLGGADVVHGTNYFVPPTRRARRVVTIHDLSFLVEPDLSTPAAAPYAGRLRRMAQGADGVLAYSESTRRDVVKFLDVAPEKVTVAPMAVDESFLPVSSAAAAAWLEENYSLRPPFLLFVSTLEPRKNVATLLRAFARLASDIPHNLVLVGSPGWQSEETFRLIEELALASRVIRPGFVPHDRLPAFYCAADAFVFPTRYEGFGLPLLEALTCGCPVVTANNSAVPEVVGDAAVQVDALDVAGLASAVRQVLEDTGLRESLAARGLEQAKRFSWGACAQATLALYNRLAA